MVCRDFMDKFWWKTNTGGKVKDVGFTTLDFPKLCFPFLTIKRGPKDGKTHNFVQLHFYSLQHLTYIAIEGYDSNLNRTHQNVLISKRIETQTQG